MAALAAGQMLSWTCANDQVGEFESAVSAYDPSKITVRTPKLLARLTHYVNAGAPEQIPAPAKALTFDLALALLCGDRGIAVTVRFEFPVGYPGNAPCRVCVASCAVDGGGGDDGGGDTSAIVSALTDGLVNHMATFANAAGAVFRAAGWIEEHAPRIVAAASAAAAAGPRRRSFVVFNHLLHGKEHKKEASMVKAAPGCGVNGVIYYGTPGIVVVEGDPGDVADYVRECRTIGKKPDVRIEEDAATAGGPTLAEAVAAAACTGKPATKKGLAAIELAALQKAMEALGHDEATFRQTLLGLK